MKYVREPDGLYRVVWSKAEVAEFLAPYPNHSMPVRCYHIRYQMYRNSRNGPIRAINFAHHSLYPRIHSPYSVEAWEAMAQRSRDWLVLTLEAERQAAQPPARPAQVPLDLQQQRSPTQQGQVVYEWTEQMNRLTREQLDAMSRSLEATFNPPGELRGHPDDDLPF